MSDGINPHIGPIPDEEASDSLSWWEEHLGCAEDSAERYAICKSCPNFIDLTKQCKLCGCFMFIKCRLPNMQCPDKPPRWRRSNKRSKMSKHSPHYVEGYDPSTANLDTDDPRYQQPPW